MKYRRSVSGLRGFAQDWAYRVNGQSAGEVTAKLPSALSF